MHLTSREHDKLLVAPVPVEVTTLDTTIPTRPDLLEGAPGDEPCT